ncbi:MAG: GH92 family glycosyl hydrolase, partial [bacterium]
MRKERKALWLVLIIMLAFSVSSREKNASAAEPVDYVDPMIGTGGVSHIFPGAVVPFGMVQLSPDTGGTHGLWLSSAWKWCAGYHYEDETILGFSHVHRSGMGAGDWGDILIMPATGPLHIKPGEEEEPEKGYRSRFFHKREKATPGYYSVDLLDYGIRAELTAAQRAGFHRYTFPETDQGHVLFDLGHGLGDTPLYAKVRINGDNEVVGTRASTGRVPFQAVHFCARFQKPFQSFGVWNGPVKAPGVRRARGAKIGAWVDYKTSEGEKVPVKVGISYTSPEQACANLEADIGGRDFDRVREEARRSWNRELKSIEIEPGEGYSEEEREKWLTIFYSALYHSFLFPATFGDADGTYTIINNKPGRTGKADFTYYSDFSIWDTFRSQMPLLTLVQPSRTEDMIKTIVRQYQDSGR